MILNKLYTVLWCIGFIAIALAIDFIRKTYHIPISILDILLFPSSTAIIVYFIIKYLFNRRSEAIKYLRDDSTIKKIGLTLVALCVFLPLGIWCLWMGVTEPIGYLLGSGVHGYTLITVGILISGFSFIFIYVAGRSILSNIKT